MLRIFLVCGRRSEPSLRPFCRLVCLLACLWLVSTPHSGPKKPRQRLSSADFSSKQKFNNKTNIFSDIFSISDHCPLSRVRIRLHPPLSLLFLSAKNLEAHAHVGCCFVCPTKWRFRGDFHLALIPALCDWIKMCYRMLKSSAFLRFPLPFCTNANRRASWASDRLVSSLSPSSS